MRKILKKIYLAFPFFLKRFVIACIENYNEKKINFLKDYPRENSLPKKKVNEKKNILIYHLTALYYAGTEKTLQIIAEALSQKYNVFILHSSDTTKPNRRKEVEKYATLIPFTYTSISKKYPYYIEGMDPHIRNVISEYNIDLLVTAGTGKSEYPFITIKEIPIILVNIFGAPTVQKNIRKIIFISKEVLIHSEKYTGKDSRNIVAYIPVNTHETEETVPSLREKLSIPSDHFIFGRIGRDSDGIFDPIGIEAFKKLVNENNKVHYVIVSPPPALQKIVKEQQIPNVHFLPATADEKELWSFYYGIDGLAHFRFDGETFGLNIAEAMFAGKPIISHRSHIWNAHLEYLDDSFSRVVPRDDTEAYYDAMGEFVMIHSSNKENWERLTLSAKTKARTLFSKQGYMERVQEIVSSEL